MFFGTRTINICGSIRVCGLHLVFLEIPDVYRMIVSAMAPISSNPKCPPQVLSSPWVRFPLGRVLRGTFMVVTFVVWLDATFLRGGTVSYLDPELSDSTILPLALILVW